MGKPEYTTVNRELVRYLLTLGQGQHAVELANLWAEINYWNGRRERFVAGAYERGYGTSADRLRKLLTRLESLGGITRKGPSHWPETEANQPPWGGEGAGVLRGLSKSKSQSKSQSESRSGLTAQQQEEMLRIWNSQCDQRSYLIRHKSVTSDAQRAALKHLKDFPDVALGAAVASFLTKKERWMREQYQKTGNRFALRAVLNFRDFPDHLHEADPVALHSVESPPPDDEHPLFLPHRGKNQYGPRLTVMLTLRLGAADDDAWKPLSAEERFNIHREAWAMYTDMPHPDDTRRLAGWEQYGGAHWPTESDL